MDRNDNRLKEYLDLIMRKQGGIEGQIETLRSNPESVVASPRCGLESFGGQDPGEKVELARRGLEQLQTGQPLSPQVRAGLEAIIDEDLRPAFFVTKGTFVADHPIWRDLNNAPHKQRIEKAILSIGRIELPGHPRLPFGGTGSVVGKGLIMTNRHVAEIFTTGIGDRRLKLIADSGIDFLQERGGQAGTTLRVRNVVMIHPYWDMAILSVDGLPADREPLKLSLKDSRTLPERSIFIVGYPAFDGRNPTDVQNKLFEQKFRVKRLQPGQLHGTVRTASFGKLVPAAAHDCSTLGGNSGSPVLDLETGELLSLHFGGLYHEKNYSVPASELAKDQRVVDTGIEFAGRPSGSGHVWSAWWDRADQQEEEETAGAVGGGGGGSGSTPALQATGDGGSTSTTTLAGGGGSIAIEVPLVITVSLGRPAPAVSVAAKEAVADGGLEAMREPWHDTNYATRGGYSPNFLSEGGDDAPADAFGVPMPGAKNATVLASTKTGERILPYQNFSIAMHGKRRLALFTAANVTKEPKLRKPDPTKQYTRKALTGLEKNDREKWFQDERLDEDFQIPDVFFTKDRGSFDKGHLVRRDDIAWGRTYDEVLRANGDSYHVTNCSPQIMEFNQASKGEDNWGDLENHVLSEAASERLCVFAGPVLTEEDEVFVGKGDGGATLRAKIPSRFWKVIVARVESGIATYGFVLEQDLSNVDFREFTVPLEFTPAMYTIGDIEEMTGVVFDARIRNADQYETIRGGEVGMRCGAKRKRR